MSERLSRLLGLKSGGQDWGIENADPARVAEFIEFYENSTREHPHEPEYLAEIILASAQEALDAGRLTNEARARLVRFIRNRRKEFPLEMQHWIRKQEHEWSLVSVIKESVA